MCFVSAFGDVFSSLGVREPQPVACKTFSRFGEAQNVSSKCCFVSAFGDVFSSIWVREPKPAASEAFSRFGEAQNISSKCVLFQRLEMYSLV